MRCSALLAATFAVVAPLAAQAGRAGLREEVREELRAELRQIVREEIRAALKECCGEHQGAAKKEGECGACVVEGMKLEAPKLLKVVKGMPIAGEPGKPAQFEFHIAGEGKTQDSGVFEVHSYHPKVVKAEKGTVATLDDVTMGMPQKLLRTKTVQGKPQSIDVGGMKLETDGTIVMFESGKGQPMVVQTRKAMHGGKPTTCEVECEVKCEGDASVAKALKAAGECCESAKALTECCEEAKKASKSECCEEAKQAGSSECCEEAKKAPKAGACGECTIEVCPAENEKAHGKKHKKAKKGKKAKKHHEDDDEHEHEHEGVELKVG